MRRQLQRRVLLMNQACSPRDPRVYLRRSGKTSRVMAPLGEDAETSVVCDLSARRASGKALPGRQMATVAAQAVRFCALPRPMTSSASVVLVF